MKEGRVLNILERILDDLCDVQGIYETIQNLIEMGVEDDELRDLKFEIGDIEIAHERQMLRDNNY